MFIKYGISAYTTFYSNSAAATFTSDYIAKHAVLGIEPGQSAVVKDDSDVVEMGGLLAPNSAEQYRADIRKYFLDAFRKLRLLTCPLMITLTLCCFRSNQKAAWRQPSVANNANSPR